MQCTKCGKEMTDPETGGSMIGMTLSSEGIKMNQKYLQHQWGRYYGAEIAFCFECVIDAIMSTNPSNEEGK